jgi:hypothetical protein
LNENEKKSWSEPWKRLFRDEPDRVAELIFAFSVVVFAFLGWQNAKSGSQQTDQLISAAKYNALAADRNANAAASFADSARKINDGINNAVGKLQDQANQIERSADAAQDANDRATEFFREQQSPELSLSVSPHDFGEQDASIEVALKNSGHSSAKEVGLRWYINSIGEDNIKKPRARIYSFSNGRLPPSYPEAETWNEFADESKEEPLLTQVFDDMIDPNKPFDQQAPILPSELDYGRIKDLGSREETTLKRLKTPFNISSGLDKIGTLHITVGEVGPDQTTTFTAQGEAAKWYDIMPSDRIPLNLDEIKVIQAGTRVLYFSCRFTYTDRYHPNVIQRSPDFCFRYVPITGNFESCVKPQR